MVPAFKEHISRSGMGADLKAMLGGQARGLLPSLELNPSSRVFSVHECSEQLHQLHRYTFEVNRIYV